MEARAETPVRTLNRRRLLLALVLFALIPLAERISGLASLAIVTGLLALLIAYETRSYGASRAGLRHTFAVEGPEAV